MSGRSCIDRSLLIFFLFFSPGPFVSEIRTTVRSPTARWLHFSIDSHVQRENSTSKFVYRF